MQHTVNKQNTLLISTIEGERKNIYIKPSIEWIPLDNEISLALESAPPEGPGEGSGEWASLVPRYKNDNPFDTNIV